MWVYAAATIEYRADLGGHVVSPLVPDTLMQMPNAWSEQVEVGTGLFKLDLSGLAVAAIASSPALKAECSALGMRPVTKPQIKAAIRGLIGVSPVDPDPDPGDVSDWNGG